MSDAARSRPALGQRPDTSVVRTVLAFALMAAGIAWIAVYVNVVQDGQRLTAAGEIGRWNFMIGLGVLFLGMVVSAHPGTPLGRGRGVVVGMLTCFLVGLVWICVYYVAGPDNTIPVLRNLDQYNLLVGIAFMAVGFVYATKWE